MAKNWAAIRRCQRAFPNPGTCQIPGCEAKAQRHHRNRNREDNSPENIEFICQKHHAEEHIRAGDWGTMHRPKSPGPS